MRILSLKTLFLIACVVIVGAGLDVAAGISQTADTTGRSVKTEPACTLRVHVDGLRNSNGVVGAVIFASRSGWPEDTAKSLHHWPTEIPPGKHEATAVWENLPPGNYGVAVIHDENRNRKLDRNFLGIPREGFGFANNPHVGFSAPPFNAAIVDVTCPVTEIPIHLQYK
jgi:uncharacterized protein (DUF2141 family)